MKNSRRITLAVIAALAGVGIGRWASADVVQDQTVAGDAASLAGAGYGGLNGTNINVGVVEAGGGLANISNAGGANEPANTNLLDGNPDLPNNVLLYQLTNNNLANGGFALPAGLTVGNHATEVTGVIAGTGTTAAADTGIAPNAFVYEAGITNAQNSQTLIQTALNTYNASVINMSFGAAQVVKNGAGTALVPQNNGSALTSRFVDWAATRYNGVMVVAGNETADSFIKANGSISFGNDYGSPSDSYNSINVAATGVRTGANNPIDYWTASSYNRTNVTSDVSPITGYGRLKTDLVAPGGDPFDISSLKVGGAYPAGYKGTLANPPANGFNDQFTSTAGGAVSGGGSDTYNGNGVGGAYVDPTTGSAYTTVNGAGQIVGTTIAGTSFAAPVVSGAAALLQQYSFDQAEGGNHSFSTDHRLMKALLLNGAAKVSPDGEDLRDEGGQTWGRLPGAGAVTLPAGITADQFSNDRAPVVRPGLDPNLGTGQLNVVNSLNNYAAGQHGPGSVPAVGWDVQTVAQGTAANTITDQYDFTDGLFGGTFQATLAWDDPVSITANAGAGNTYQGTSVLSRGTLTNLDLYLFDLNGDNTLGQNVDFSTSDIDNVEYIYVPDLAEGNYALVVANAGYATPSDTTYGLAWATEVVQFVDPTVVPEPGCLMLVGLGAMVLLPRRRAKRV